MKAFEDQVYVIIALFTSKDDSLSCNVFLPWEDPDKVLGEIS